MGWSESRAHVIEIALPAEFPSQASYPSLFAQLDQQFQPFLHGILFGL